MEALDRDHQGKLADLLSIMTTSQSSKGDQISQTYKRMKQTAEG